MPMPQYNPQNFGGPSNNDFPGGGPGGQLPNMPMMPPQPQMPMVQQPGYMPPPAMGGGMPPVYNPVDPSMPQMQPMGLNMQPGMPPMQPPPAYQGGTTAGGPGPNFEDAVAAGLAHAESLNSDKDDIPKAGPSGGDKPDPSISNNMDDIEARLKALSDL